MKASRFLNPFQKKAVRTMIIVYLFSLFQLPILVHAQTPVLPVLTQIEDTTDSGTDNPSPPSEEITGAMCQMPEEKIVSCDGTSMLVQGYQMITCNDACGVKAGTTIPLKKIDEITYCLKDTTCGQAIKDYCNGLLDTKINQGPRTVQNVIPLHCTEEFSNNNEGTNNNDDFDDSLSNGGSNKDLEELEQGTPGTTTYTDYSCCGATINAEKPLGQAVENYSFTCNSDCKNPGRTIAFDQKFKADNNCNTPEECLGAMQHACHRCGVEFDGEEIGIDSTYDPLRPEIGKTAADYIAETLTTVNQIAGLLTNGTLGDLTKSLLGDELFAKAKDFLGDAGIYINLFIDLIQGNVTDVLVGIGSLLLANTLGTNPIARAINGALIALGIGLVPGVGRIINQITSIAWNYIKGPISDFIDGIFSGDPRKKKFTCDGSCGASTAGKEITLREIEEKTGCAGAGNCADEAFSFCQGNELVHKSLLVENCHNCDTKILNENNQELIPGEREHDDFMDMQYQCSGEGCSEEPGVIISAETVHSMYDCSESELKKKCKAEGRENEDECYQACIEEASQKYCMGMGGDFVATDACNAIYDPSNSFDDRIDDYECSSHCGLRQGTEIKKKDIEEKYKCITEAACQYYATVECINPGHAKNKEESVKVAESQGFCIAVFNHNGLYRDTFTCASACVKVNKEVEVRDLENQHSCDGKGCQEYANARCGGDRTESSCRISGNQYAYNCELGCKKAPNTIITRSYLQTNYNCQGDSCKPLAQEFCEETLPEPECNVGKGGDGNAFVADHYLCGAGCEKPEHLQVMKRDLAKQLGCNEDGREGCRQTAIDYCDNKHPSITISDKSKIGVVVDKVGEYINSSAIIAGGLQTVFDGLGGFGIKIPTRATQTLKVVQQVTNIYGQSINIYSQIYQVVTSDRGSRNEVIKNLYVINNFKGTIDDYIKSYKDLTFKADENAIEGTCAFGAGNLSTQEKIGFLGKIVNGMVVITQVFAPDAMKKLQETLNPFGGGDGTGGPGGDGGPGGSTNPYVNAGVVPYGATCPELDEIIAATNPSAGSHSSAGSYGYRIDGAASCETKQSLLEAYCDKTLPANYKAEKENDIIKIIRTDIAIDDLVCSDPFRRDCNPFEQGDEFLVEIYEPVIVPDNDPVKAPGNCRDGIQNHGETGLDCGEVCGTCCDGSRLGCREKVAGSVQISCSSFYDIDSCSSAGCSREINRDDPDERAHYEYCTGTPQICNFSDKASCGTDTNCLRGCDSDLPPKTGN